MSKKPAPKDTLVIDYDLFDLPTAQHKAGLAGLLRMVQSMKQRHLGSIPDILTVTRNSVSISFSEESVQALFDDLYDATLVEVDSGNKWQKATPKRLYERETVDAKG
jgi:CRISPR-associated protein Cmx8